MRKSSITATFKADINTVWDIVINNEDYAWRSDLSKISISEDGNSFTEYTKDGYQTNFRITHKELYNRYEFDMTNKNFTGHWVGVFSETQNRGTKIEFSEKLLINNYLI